MGSHLPRNHWPEETGQSIAKGFSRLNTFLIDLDWRNQANDRKSLIFNDIFSDMDASQMQVRCKLDAKVFRGHVFAGSICSHGRVTLPWPSYMAGLQRLLQMAAAKHQRTGVVEHCNGRSRQRSGCSCNSGQQEEQRCKQQQ